MNMIQDHLWENLFLKFNVDLTFWGHHHVYQRSCSWEKINASSDQIHPTEVFGIGRMHALHVAIAKNRFSNTMNANHQTHALHKQTRWQA